MSIYIFTRNHWFFYQSCRSEREAEIVLNACARAGFKAKRFAARSF